MNLRHEINIDAPIERVWNTSVDVENWHKWTPTVETISLKDEFLRLGSSAIIKQPGMSEATWIVTHFQEKDFFVWETSVSGINMTASHKLFQSENDQTKNVLEIEVTGLLGVLLWPFLRGKIKDALRKENEGLKYFCENFNNDERSSSHSAV